MALVTTNVIGYTSTTDNAFTAIRATTYVEQSANAQRSVVSSDANDDGSPGGTGARTIRITYYDQAMAGPFTEDLTLNGTTPVDTVSSTICFIEKMEVLTVGSQLGNVGTIAMKSTTGGGGSNIGSIAPGDNQTQWCHHYVPAGKLAKILDVVGAIKGANSGAMHVRRATPTVANTPEITVAPVMRIPAGSSERYQFNVPIVISGPARITLYAKGDVASSTMDWLAGFGLVEV